MSTENLFNKEAREKLKKIAENIDFTMMATALNSQPLHVIPMSTKKVDNQGTIWFLSNRNSQHNRNIEKDSKMHLIYSNKSDMQFLNVYGNAKISKDLKIIEELYQSSDDTWFEGKNDPNITAIAVKPIEAFYWDPKNNKLITLIKMGAGAITGNEPDLLDQGKLKT